jgi:hypothetical protein
VLNVPKGGLQVLFEHQKQQTLPCLLYSNTLIAFSMQLSRFMKFTMEFFIAYPLVSNYIRLNK